MNSMLNSATSNRWPSETIVKGIGDMMKQAQAMQSRLAEAQAEIAKLSVVGESGAGLVKVTLSGRHEARKVDIDDTLLSSLIGAGGRSEDKQMLEDLIAAAITDAARRVDAAQKEKMSSFAKGLGLPPGFNLPF